MSHYDARIENAKASLTFKTNLKYENNILCYEKTAPRILSVASTYLLDAHSAARVLTGINLLPDFVLRSTTYIVNTEGGNLAWRSWLARRLAPISAAPLA